LIRKIESSPPPLLSQKEIHKRTFTTHSISHQQQVSRGLSPHPVAGWMENFGAILALLLIYHKSLIRRWADHWQLPYTSDQCHRIPLRPPGPYYNPFCHYQTPLHAITLLNLTWDLTRFRLYQRYSLLHYYVLFKSRWLR